VRALDLASARIDDLERELTRLRPLAEKVPKEGSVVLAGDDAKAWEAYKALGKPDDVKKKLEKLPELETKVADVDNAEQMAKAAEPLGWNPKPLAKLAKDHKLTFVEVKDEVVNGKTVKVPYVKGPEANATPVKLEDFAQQHFADFMPALTTPASGTGGPTSRTTTSSGTTHPVQRGSGGPPPAVDTGKLAEEKAGSGAYGF
jgi:hypothetical protein